MAKIIRRKRKFRLNNLLALICVFSFIGYLGSVTLLKSYNISLNYELAQLNMENEEANRALESLRLEVTSYTDREYIMNVVNENGEDLTYSQQRITYIYNTDQEDGE